MDTRRLTREEWLEHVFETMVPGSDIKAIGWSQGGLVSAGVPKLVTVGLRPLNPKAGPREEEVGMISVPRPWGQVFDQQERDKQAFMAHELIPSFPVPVVALQAPHGNDQGGKALLVLTGHTELRRDPGCGTWYRIVSTNQVTAARSDTLVGWTPRMLVRTEGSPYGLDVWRILPFLALVRDGMQRWG